jgi:biopolymer transport protein ExbD
VKFPRSAKPDTGINLTPLIDVVFLLLIFFMVTTTFTRETRMLITLPEADGEALVSEQQVVLELVVSRDGSYSVNGQNLINGDIKTIMAALKEASEGNKDIPLMITADAQSTHQAVITAMDAAGRLGFESLNIATQQPQEP